MHELVWLSSGTANVLQTLQCFGQLCSHCCPHMCACRLAIKLTCCSIANAQKQLRNFTQSPVHAEKIPALQTSALCKLQLFVYSSSLQTSAVANFSSCCCIGSCDNCACLWSAATSSWRCGPGCNRGPCSAEQQQLFVPIGQHCCRLSRVCMLAHTGCFHSCSKRYTLNFNKKQLLPSKHAHIC